MQSKFRNGGAFVLAALLVGGSVQVSADTARDTYTRVLARERTVRVAATKPTLHQIRAVIEAYEGVVRKYPASGYSDNAVWQAANLALLAHERFAQAQDKRTGLRLLEQLTREYPSSSLAARASEVARQFEVRPVPAPASPSPAPALPPTVEPQPSDALPAPPPTAPASTPVSAGGSATLRDIKRTPLPDGIRVTLEFDGESAYRSERLENPRRVFFDLKNVKTVAALQDATLRFSEDAVREIRLGRHPGATRVVLDMTGVDNYSVFTLYEPFRVVIDFQRATATASPVVAPPPPPPTTTRTVIAAAPMVERPQPKLPALTPPAVPSANSDGQFSLARQLGLGISRIVIDAGHGGHDPGARANGLSEAELVLDVAHRVAKLLEKQPGVEVVMTRDSDVFIPLEERTAIANREGADLFLSIHANASRNARARGIETYFLNFATNPEAEAIAARENSGSARTMNNLPDIVRAIALNNKIDESRDLARIVQTSMMRKLSARNGLAKDLGVKQAPFVVLIGAGMPSVLAEISFLTNKQEAQLLKSGAYRQQIAEALLDGVVKYQQSLKRPRAIATR